VIYHSQAAQLVSSSRITVFETAIAECTAV